MHGVGGIDKLIMYMQDAKEILPKTLRRIST